MDRDYRPAPRDTSDVELPSSVEGLTFSHWDQRPLSPSQLRYAADDVRYLPALRRIIGERLDKTGHENWARQRMDDGWKYGPKRDDARKEHPSLVPYEKLSEEEKQYDRRTAMETLKTILSLGYRIDRE